MKITHILFLLVLILAPFQVFGQTNNTDSAYTEQAVVLYESHKFKECIPLLNQAISLNKKNGKAWYYRGMAKMHDNQKGFCKDLEESLKLGFVTSADIHFYGCNTRVKK